MGTRGMVHVRSGDGRSKPITSIYHHYDSYPSGLGEKIKSSLYDGHVVLVNGLGMQNPGDPHQFNGMGDLAAYLVSSLKGDQSGNVYLEPPSYREEEYTYTVYNRDKEIFLKLVGKYRKKKIMYNGPLKNFYAIDLKEEG